MQSTYNDFGQVSVQYQAHAGAVNTGTTPKVQYSYANGSDNTIRPTAITYPNGRQIDYNYGTSGGMDDVLSRLQSIDESSSQLAAYTYLGPGMVVQVDYTEPDIRYDLITDSGDDPYDGLDRFDRVIDCLWRDYGSSTDAVRIKYGYDRVSNRTWRVNPARPDN